MTARNKATALRDCESRQAANSSTGKGCQVLQGDNAAPGVTPSEMLDIVAKGRRCQCGERRRYCKEYEASKDALPSEGGVTLLPQACDVSAKRADSGARKINTATGMILLS
jgi:hypothetical protein